MEIIRKILSALFKEILRPFSGRSPMWSLVPFGVLLGMTMLLVFRLTSNQKAIRKVKARLAANLYEMRLFVDDPLVVWRAQWGLLAANVRYIALMLVPVLVMAIPLTLFLSQLECFYGHSPFQPGQAAVVTVQVDTNDVGVTPELRVPDGVVLDSPPVHIDGGRQISWRIRALRPVAGNLTFVFPNLTLEKSIKAGKAPQYVSVRRVSSGLELLLYPGESQLNQTPANWIEVGYPSASVHALGLDLHWLIWLIGLSMISALLMKKRFGVSF